MISCSLQFVGVFVLFSAFVNGIVGGSNDNRYEGGEQHISTLISSRSHTEPDELCRILTTAKTSLLLDFQRSDFVLPNFFAKCDVSNDCSSLSCRALLGGDKVKAGVRFQLCQPLKTVEFWMDVPKLQKEKWSYIFPIDGNYNGESQRVEIKRRLNKGLASLEKKWFIKVFSVVDKNESGEEYLRLISNLQLCETESESTCENKTLLNLPPFLVRNPCDVPQHLTDSKMLSSASHKSSSRKRTSRNAWNPEDSHTKNTTQENVGVGSPSHVVGEPCDTSQIFSCGNGAGCVHAKDGKGLCQCLNDFLPDSSGTCQEKPASIPIDPPSQPITNNNSYSTALGALFSVFILLSLAAAVFFGTKYHVFSRIRNRLPLNLRCWPWPVLRRSSPLEDNVSMVHPIDQDDDEPLLL